MKKILEIIVISFILLVFVLIMTTGGIVKKPLNNREDVVAFILAISENVDQEQWEDASYNMNNLDEAWDKIRFRIQFSIEGARIYEFEGLLSRLKGAIKAKSHVNTIIQLEALLGEWNRLEE
ncbi:MAG: hypothetical protein CVV02_14870 [Firmicutes bacterium HGW-Firmicutes-7]|nr:MAG: hypothetical protein CVV02_14870 [Firmicutes bacterium HGW-Firmicutes-7]